MRKMSYAHIKGMLEIYSNFKTVSVQIQKEKKNLGPDGTRTRNPLVRSQVPYPLGHKTLHVKSA